MDDVIVMADAAPVQFVERGDLSGWGQNAPARISNRKFSAIPIAEAGPVRSSGDVVRGASARGEGGGEGVHQIVEPDRGVCLADGEEDLVPPDLDL